MDFKIIQGKNGITTMSWDKSDDITTEMWTSLNIKKGSIFNNPNFGLDLSDIDRVTDQNISKIQQRLNKAVQWLVDIGKAKTIEILVELDTSDINRVNYSISAVQADDKTVTLDDFITVGGPSDGFSFP